MHSLREFFRRGDPAIWFAGSGLGDLPAHDRRHDRAHPRQRARLLLAEAARQADADRRRGRAGRDRRPRGHSNIGAARCSERHRIQLKVGNRDITGVDFRWIDESAIARQERPVDAVYVERREYGPFIGMVTAIRRGRPGRSPTGSDAAWTALQPLIDEGRARPRRRSGGSSATRSAASTISSNGSGSGSDGSTSSASERRRRISRPSAPRSARRSPRLQTQYAQAREGAGGAAGRGIAHARDARRPPRARRRSCRRSTSTAPIRANELSTLGQARRLRVAALGVRVRRPAGVQHRGRHLPGHLRDGHDGASS